MYRKVISLSSLYNFRVHRFSTLVQFSGDFIGGKSWHLTALNQLRRHFVSSSEQARHVASVHRRRPALYSRCPPDWMRTQAPPARLESSRRLAWELEACRFPVVVLLFKAPQRRAVASPLPHHPS